MLNLNGVELPDFVKVNSVDFSILPTIENNLLNVRGKNGAYLMSQDVNTRVFTVNITIIAEEINGVMEASRELASWLYHKEPVKLVFADEPDKYYMVLPDGDTNITETVNIGQGAITFVCTEAFAYGETKEEVFELTDEQVAEVFVAGSAETHPQLEVTVNEAISTLVVNTEDTSVILGEAQEVTKTPINPTPTVLYDHMRSTDGWVEDVKHSVDGGIVAGSGYEANAEALYVVDRDYGTSSRWHGASAVKMLDRPVHDFDVNFRVDFRPTNKKQMGRLELYLLDENDVQFGKLCIEDNFRGADKKNFEARIGTLTGGQYFLNNNLDETGRFYGRILLTREGRKWTVSVADTAQNGRFINELFSSSWFDSLGVWDDYKLAKVQIHTGAYGTYEPIYNMFISYIKVNERLTLGEDDAPIIAIPNDTFLIDNQKMQVYLNGELRYDLINPASNFIKLKKGFNTLETSPSDVSLKVTYPERWL